MTIETGDSRFKLIGAGQMSPAQCVVTGQVTELVDLGRNIQNYGRLYLSIDAIRELAAVAGIVDNKPATVQQAEWYTQGYSDAVKKDFDGTLRGLVAELAGAADRLELVGGQAPLEDAVSAAEEPSGEPADGGVDLLKSDGEAAVDERETVPARRVKGSRGVRGFSLDDLAAE